MTGFKIAVLSDGFQDYGVIGSDGKWWELCKKCRLKPLEALESMNQWASVRHFHQSNISTVFIESIESAPFDNPALRN
ncbi:hypothetical protein [Neisseria viridiae]|uniref:hypothetical protein n=1 Tax=Neisseria viridiae TaxID=2830648 RepID=UPI002659A473|nr:hypothetical protein [Neisseria viridiae]